MDSSVKRLRKRKIVTDITKRHFRRLIRANMLQSLNENVGVSEIPTDGETKTNCTTIGHSGNVQELASCVDTGSVENSLCSINCDIVGGPLLDDREDCDDHADACRGSVKAEENSSGCANTSELGDSSFGVEIGQWATKHSIPHLALGDLLQILRKRPIGASLPKDPRTLLKTPRCTEMVEMHPGNYCHFGVKSGLEETILYEGIDFVSTIKLKVGIDGLPISDSNTSQLWPILGNVIPSKKVFLIGLYHGYSKPSDSNSFLTEFVKEINDLISEGFKFLGKSWPVMLQSIICDAPAKSFVQKTKSHNAYFGCSKCTVEGDFVDGRMCYPERDSAKRTDANFRLKLQEEYHLGNSILTSINNFGMVSRIPLDYMHLVCLGVVKKTILMWIKGPKNVRLSGAKVNQVSKNLLSLRDLILKEFARRPRGLQDIAKWKATELRQFILYTCFNVLKNVLHPVLFTHFMTLHVALRILTSQTLLTKHQDYAHSLLDHFVETFGILYGRQFLSHNVHGLIHLVDDTKVLGTLDSFSAFPFENYLRTLKKGLRKHDCPLQQIHRRYMERKLLGSSNSVFTAKLMKPKFEVKNEHSDGPLIKGLSGCQFKSVTFAGFNICISKPDNCCAVRSCGRIYVVVKNICMTTMGNIFIIGQQFLKVKPLYNEPCDSTLIGCAYVEELSPTLDAWLIDNEVVKCMKLPWRNGYSITPLTHMD